MNCDKGGLTIMEMKEMVYNKKRILDILYEGEYNGYKFAILNLGAHPTAYVENKNQFDEYDQANEATDYFPHGAFTFCDKCYWHDNDETVYVGWDYGHCDDFAGYNLDGTDPYWQSLKKWTTEEIYEEVKKTIDLLSTLKMTITYKEVKHWNKGE